MVDVPFNLCPVDGRYPRTCKLHERAHLRLFLRGEFAREALQLFLERWQ